MTLPKVKLNKNQKILASIAIVVIGIFVIEGMVFSPLRKKLRAIRQQIRVAEAQLSKDLAFRQDKDKLTNEYNTYRKYLEGITDPEQLVAEFLKEIERLAKDSGVSVINLSPQASPENVKENKSREYKADLRLEATASQLISFIYKVQESKLLIGLDKISISARDEQATLLRAEILLSMAAP